MALAEIAGVNRVVASLRVNNKPVGLVGMIDRGWCGEAANYDVVAMARNGHSIRVSGALHELGIDLPVAATSLVGCDSG